MADDLDRVHVIAAALRAGWRPGPLDGVTLADFLGQGDPYGRFWTLTEPRRLAHDEDRSTLAIAADAATTYLSSIGGQ